MRWRRIPRAFTAIGQALVTFRDWTFLFGPGLMAAFNALMFATLLYRSGLVPRGIPLLGLIGAPLLLTSGLLTFFGFITQTDQLAEIAALPIAAWELSAGCYLTIKGFRTITAAS